MKKPFFGGRVLVLVLALGLALLPAARLAADRISFKADSVQSTLAKGKERTILSGRASVQTGKLSISADRIELFGDDFRYLDCSGTVRVADGEQSIRLETQRLYYDRTRKLARAQGPSVLQDEKNELVLKAEWIESDGEAEVTSAQVAVRIFKGKISTRSEYVLYRRADGTLELTGSPSAYRDGDVYRASKISVDIETEDISLEGSVSGSVSEKSPEAVKPGPGGAPEAAED